MSDDLYEETSARIAAVLAARGLAARKVRFHSVFGVEVRLEEEQSAVWCINPDVQHWAYICFDHADGGQQITAQGVIDELAIDAEPERFAWIIANFPYGDIELDESQVREAVSKLLSEVEELSEEEREAILAQAVPEQGEGTGIMSWDALGESGLVWAINRHILNPLGYSFVMMRSPDRVASGWAIVGDGEEPVTMEPLADANGFKHFGAWVESLRDA